jgi:hypothetical protein
VLPIGVFYSELEVYFNKWLNGCYYVYAVCNELLHKIKFNDDDIKWLQIENRYYTAENDIPENIKFLKINQCKDYKLICLTKKIGFLFLIPLKTENNYYYIFIIVTKNEKIIFNIINYNLNLITFKSLKN